MILIISGATNYGKQIQLELLNQGMTRKWLIEEMRIRSHKYVDGSNLHKLMTGKIKSSWMTDAIQQILGVEYKEE